MMPTSDDYDDSKMSGDLSDSNQQSSSHSNPHGLSKAELRKSNKPIMEKKRRARINHCLNELKSLILEAMKKDPARHTKLEKADILEMTVKYLQTIQRQQMSMAIQADPNVVHKFKTGFSDCADEVNRYIASLEGIDTDVKQRLMNHLSGCITSFPPSPFANGYARSTPSHYNSSTLPPHTTHTTNTVLPQDLNNNNGRVQMGGVQLIPSRLPTGEFALIMPNSSSQLPFFNANSYTGANNLDLSSASYSRPSAFNAVTKSKEKQMSSSPPLSPVSSISSCGDDSLPPSEYNTSAVTPPLLNSQDMYNAFPTPPSGGSVSLHSAVLSSLQQPQVSSTTENNRGKLDVLYVNKKRPYPVDMADPLYNTVKTEPAEKKLKEDCASPSPDNVSNEQQDPAANENMWRPW